jgi:hypothetical protein
MSSPDVRGRWNTAAATAPVTRAVRTTPGTVKSPRPSATRLSTLVESCRPPWKRMKETPRVRISCAPMESSGMSIASETAGPSSAPAPRRRSMRGTRRMSAASWQTSPAPSMIAIVRITSLTVTRRILHR